MLVVYERNEKTVRELKRILRRLVIGIHPYKAPGGQKERNMDARSVLKRSLAIVESERLSEDWEQILFTSNRNANIRSDHVDEITVLFSMNATKIENNISMPKEKLILRMRRLQM